MCKEIWKMKCSKIITHFVNWHKHLWNSYSLWDLSYYYPPTYVLIFLVISFLLAFPPITYKHSSYLPSVLHALPIIILDFITLIICTFQRKAPRCAVFSILLSLNPFLVQIFFSASRSKPPSICAPPLMWDQVSHSYSTTGEIMVLYSQIFTFLDDSWKDRRLWTEW
jgi:hypothetical protein